MKYLVTGGAGFIGSNLVKELLRQGHKVDVLDNLSTGALINVPEMALFHRGEPKTFFPSIQEDKYQGIFHLGITCSIPQYERNPHLVSDSVEDMICTLQYCKVSKSRLVFASTANIYAGLPIPWKETGQSGYRVNTLYSDTRLFLERLSYYYRSYYGVESIGLRFFSIYGPGEEFKGAYANLITQLIWTKKSNKKFPVYGDGTQTRDSTWVGDVVRALILSMEGKEEYGIFNVGTGKNQTVNELASRIGVEVEYIKNPLKVYTSKQLADTSRAEKILGFKAKVSVEEGIQCLLKLHGLQ